MEIRSHIFMALWRWGEVINDLADWFVNEAVEVNLSREKLIRGIFLRGGNAN